MGATSVCYETSFAAARLAINGCCEPGARVRGGRALARASRKAGRREEPEAA